VASVTAELSRLGVQGGRAVPGCRGVFAQVELDRDGGIAVAIRDGSRRSEGRVVSDAAVAAAWIDSWLHDDLDGTTWLVATPSTTTTVHAASQVPPTARHDALPQPRGPLSPPLIEQFAIAAAYEQSWSDDGVSASGASVSGCLRVGRACIGGRARYSREGDRIVNLTAMNRSDVSVLATASVPFAVGRMTVAPELGLGFGRTSTRRVDGCMPAMMNPNCDPMDPNCQMLPTDCLDANGNKTFVGDGFASATFTPRIAAALRIAIPLFDHVWLDGVASATLAPFGHSDPFAVAPDPNGTTNPGNVPVDQLALPGEALGGLVLGVGLRVGAP
jgi:hypothetical protein